MRSTHDPASTTVLVCGATGYLGRHVCTALFNAGYRVRALVRDAKRLKEAHGAVKEVVTGEATKPATLKGLCDGVDIVFSSLGVHSMKGPGPWKVDYGANHTIAQMARQAGVKHVIFVSAAGAKEMRRNRIAIAEARERVGDELRRSGMIWTLLRPTGFFNDYAEQFQKIRRTGSFRLIGEGRVKTNPIHGEDLANIVVRAITDESFHNMARTVGGPEVLSVRAIIEHAFAAAGKPEKIGSLPPFLANLMSWLMLPFNPTGARVLHFLTYAMTHNITGEEFGTHRIRPFFDQLASEPVPRL